ncbi:MAG: hypothetical protein ACW98K_06610 [Candidatus Kariarchaeaceae archaeon]|jgi:hypothetical protein
MFCKLYRVQYKGEVPDSTRFQHFQNFYEENGVKVIGGWENVEKQGELLFMTGYKDEDHYNKFVGAMKENAKYQELTQQLVGERESVEVTTLKSATDIPS